MNRRCFGRRPGFPRRFLAVALISFGSLLALLFLSYVVIYDGDVPNIKGVLGIDGPLSTGRNRTTSRKILAIVSKEGGSVSATATEERMGESCSKDDIAVYQGETTPLPSGIPTYTVQILNVCVSRCTVSHIHVSCGWFSSARLINPGIFRRVGFNDCLVNNGHAIPPGGSLSFQYANTYRYPLHVSSVACY